MTTKERIKELVPDASDDFGLADVLRAIEMANVEVTLQIYGQKLGIGHYDKNNYHTHSSWNFEENYDGQSQPTKDFIGSLLGGE